MMKVNSILALITVLLLQACDGQVEQTRDGGIKTTATRGPVEVTVTATPGQVEVGKPLKLEIEAITANDVRISMPMITPNANGTIGNFAPNSTFSTLRLGTNTTVSNSSACPWCA